MSVWSSKNCNFFRFANFYLTIPDENLLPKVVG